VELYQNRLLGLPHKKSCLGSSPRGSTNIFYRLLAHWESDLLWGMGLLVVIASLAPRITGGLDALILHIYNIIERRMCSDDPQRCRATRLDELIDVSSVVDEARICVIALYKCYRWEGARPSLRRDGRVWLITVLLKSTGR
jgi:hypothetical protein